jgi:putative transposase
VTAIAYAPTQAEAEQRRAAFEAWCRRQGYDQAAAAVGRDWDRFMTFYRFPREHWVHLRTTNIVESPLAALRLRTDAAKRFTRVANATAVIWTMLLVAESRFRRLNAPELAKRVYLGIEYRDGVEVTEKGAVA